MIIKRKLFTRWDDTDRLKEMKDSDILAEEKKKAPGFGQVASAAAAGAIGAGVVGGLAGGVGGALKKGGSMLSGARRMGKFGLVAGGLLAGGLALHKRNKDAKDNSFYNNRLKYAQHQAKRREKKDWKHNMTQREGYTY